MPSSNHVEPLDSVHLGELARLFHCNSIPSSPQDEKCTTTVSADKNTAEWSSKSGPRV